MDWVNVESGWKVESGCGLWIWKAESGAVPDLTVIRHGYLSESIMFRQTLNQLLITACLRLRRLFPLNSTLSITDLCTVDTDMRVMLYSYPAILFICYLFTKHMNMHRLSAESRGVLARGVISWIINDILILAWESELPYPLSMRPNPIYMQVTHRHHAEQWSGYHTVWFRPDFRPHPVLAGFQKFYTTTIK